MLTTSRLQAGAGTRSNRHQVEICGGAPANYLDIARFLAGLGVDSVSIKPTSLSRTVMIVELAEEPASNRPVQSAHHR